jgi:hypothetical protein
MKNKWLLSGFSLLLFVLASCGTKQNIQPTYRFDLGRTVYYKLAGSVTLAVDAGFLRYNGKIDIGADVEMTAVETNERGYKVLLDIKNPVLNGGDQQITALFYMGINYIRTWLASMILSDRGRVTVLYGTNVVIGFNSYTQLLFPDFSDMDNIWVGNTETTNYPAKLQNQEMTIVYIRQWKIAKSDGIELQVESHYNYKTFDKDEYLKSVEPQPNGTLTLDLDDTFNLLTGKMTRKNGKFALNMNIVFKQDILSYIISVQGSGDLNMTLVEQPS